MRDLSGTPALWSSTCKKTPVHPFVLNGVGMNGFEAPEGGHGLLAWNRMLLAGARFSRWDNSNNRSRSDCFNTMRDMDLIGRYEGAGTPPDPRTRKPD